MTKDKISIFNICFISVFLYSSLFSLTTLNLLLSFSSESSLFSIIIGSIIGLFLLKIFSNINDFNKCNNIFYKLDKLLPQWLKLFLQILLIICSLYFISFYIYNTSLFVSTSLLKDVSIIPITILLLIPVNYVAFHGIESLLRCSGILIYFSIFLIIISIVGLIPYSNPINLYPIVFDYNSYLSPIYYTCITVCPIFMLLIIPKSKIYNYEKYNKYFKLTYIISNIYIIINFVIIIGALGTSFAQILKFPEFIAFKKISLLNFIERLEDFLSYKILLDLFISISLIFIYINECLKHIKPQKKDKLYIYLLDLFIIFISLFNKIINIKLFIIFISIFIFIHFIIYLSIKITNH